MDYLQVLEKINIFKDIVVPGELHFAQFGSPLENLGKSSFGKISMPRIKAYYAAWSQSLTGQVKPN